MEKVWGNANQGMKGFERAKMYVREGKCVLRSESTSELGSFTLPALKSQQSG